MDEELKKALAGPTLSPEQTSRVLGTSLSLTYKLIRSGEIDSIRLGSGPRGTYRVLTRPLLRKVGLETAA